MGYIYCIAFPNGKKYIGASGYEALERIRQHVKASKKGSGSLVCKAIRRFGVGSFSWAVLGSSDSVRERAVLEQKWVEQLGTRWPLGYNATLGGLGVKGLVEPFESLRIAHQKVTMSTPQYKAKQHVIQQQVWTPDFRKAHSERIKKVYQTTDLRQRLSVAHQGHRASQETCEKRSRSLKAANQNNPSLAAATGARARKLWNDPEYHARLSMKLKAAWDRSGRKSICPEEKWPKVLQKRVATQRTSQNRAKVAAATKKQMENVEARFQIAATLSPLYRDCQFHKTVSTPTCRSDSRRLLRLWSVTPDSATFKELWLLGWRASQIALCLRYKWLEVLNASR